MDLVAILRSELADSLALQAATLGDENLPKVSDSMIPAVLAGFIAEHRGEGTAFNAVRGLATQHPQAMSLELTDDKVETAQKAADHLIGSQLDQFASELATTHDISRASIDMLVASTCPQVAQQLARITELTSLDAAGFDELLSKQDSHIKSALDPTLAQTLPKALEDADAPIDINEPEPFEDSDKTMVIPGLADRIKQSMASGHTEELDNAELMDIEFEAPAVTEASQSHPGDISTKDTQKFQAPSASTEAPIHLDNGTTELGKPETPTPPPSTVGSGGSNDSSAPAMHHHTQAKMIQPTTRQETEESTMSDKPREMYDETPKPFKWLIIPFIIFLLVVAWLLSTCSGPKGVEVSAPSIDVDASKMAGDAMEATGAAASAIGDTVTGAVEGGMDMAAEATGTVGDAVGSAIEGTADLAGSAAGAAGDVVEGGMDMAAKATGAVGDAVGSVMEGTADLAGSAAGAVGDVVEGGMDMAAKATGAVGDAMGSVMEKEVSLPDGTALTLSEGSPVDKIVTFLKSDESSTALPKAFILRGLNFESGSSRITADSGKIVADLAATLSAYTSVKVLLAGHTDSQGAAEFNKSLSASRAAAIETALASAGIADTRVKTEGFGEENPIDDNATSAGRMENRRVEVIITEK